MTEITDSEVWNALSKVMDPEIPVLSIVDLGIIREVKVDGRRIAVKLTPTFSGCPALEVMKRDVESALAELGGAVVAVDIVLSPPWTSDWISENGRTKLKQFGLAPPARHGGRVAVTFYDNPPCPFCESHDTILKNTFGSTLCRAIYYCQGCQHPFEQFKAL